MEEKYKIIKYTSGTKKGNIDKILVNNFNDFYFWDYQEQTKIKHLALRNYLDAWFAILGSQNPRINYYDGFSGCGAYYDYNNDIFGWGSPIIAGQAAISRKLYSKCYFYFNEREQENIDNLKKVLNYNKISLLKIKFIKGKYNDNINKFLDILEKNPAPTFFLIDPYGIDVDFNTLKRIMSIPRTEILLNFMYNYLNRFITHVPSEIGIDKFYGNNQWQEFKNYKDDLKEHSLVNLYREKLKEFANYTYQYRMSFPDKNKTYYYLFHITKNLKGCSIMKDAFAKCNMGKVEFLGPKQPNPAQLPLFDITESKIDILKIQIWDLYKGKIVKYIDILNQFIDSTPYLERHIREAVKKLEFEYADICRIKQKSKTVDLNDTIKFYKEHKPQPHLEEVVQQSLF